ncbi:unnamed protein product, partial [Mesorhabditis spiculigera]
MIIYFLAFPLCTIIYHPHVYCFKSRPPTQSVDPADPSISQGVAPLVHNTTATRLASLAEIAEPSSYSASPLPSAIPPLSFPNFSERDRPETKQWIDSGDRGIYHDFHIDEPSTMATIALD